MGTAQRWSSAAMRSVASTCQRTSATASGSPAHGTIRSPGPTTLHGWPRFPAAQEWLDKVNQGNTASLRTNFTRFLGEKQAIERDAAAQERLFQNFLEWTRNRK